MSGKKERVMDALGIWPLMSKAAKVRVLKAEIREAQDYLTQLRSKLLSIEGIGEPEPV